MCLTIAISLEIQLTIWAWSLVHACVATVLPWVEKSVGVCYTWWGLSYLYIITSLTRNSRLINGCEISGGYFRCFRYITCTTWQCVKQVVWRESFVVITLRVFAVVLALSQAWTDHHLWSYWSKKALEIPCVYCFVGTSREWRPWHHLMCQYHQIPVLTKLVYLISQAYKSTE